MRQVSSCHARVSPLRRSSLAALLLGFTIITNACAMLRRDDTSVVAPASVPDVLSPAERVELFDEVWKTIDERYYDASFNGADWKAVGARYRPCAEAATDDRSLYILLEVMLAELRDGHTHFQSPA